MPTKLIKMTCPKCGGTMEVDNSKEFIYCPYCGERMMIQKDQNKVVEVMQEMNKQSRQPLTKEQRRFLIIDLCLVVGCIVFCMIMSLFE